MKIKIWGDFVCPFCYAGKEQLKSAIDSLDESIELEIMSFELAPGVEDNNTMRMADVLEKQFGMSQEDQERNSKQVNAMIENAGLEINSSDLKFSNTLKAHTLTQYFKEQGKAYEFASAVYHAYFVEGAYLNKTETLNELGKQFGLSEEEVKDITESQDWIDKVHSDQRKAQERNVQSVPYVLIDDRFALSGAQSKESYRSAIKEVLNK